MTSEAAIRQDGRLNETIRSKYDEVDSLNKYYSRYITSRTWSATSVIATVDVEVSVNSKRQLSTDFVHV